jgi:hypothetical protein
MKDQSMTMTPTNRRSMALACAALALAAVAAQLPARAQGGAVTGAQALQQLYDKRDATLKVDVSTAAKMKIGQDALNFTVRSSKPGFVFVLMADSDNKKLQLLFPNRVDGNNRIAAGQDLKLPRPTWQLQSSGPAGTTTMLVIVTEGPRNLSALPWEGAFVTVPNDAAGRANLAANITKSIAADRPVCAPSSPAKGDPMCSHAFGAAIAKVEEVK